MKIVLLGAPGSGKGSISNELVRNNHFEHVSTGNLFRKVIDSNTSLGLELKNIITSGQLVSDDLTNNIVKKELLALSQNNRNFILDGYPRTIQQAEFLDNIIHLDYVFLLNVDQDLIVKRITGRRTCPKCNAIYNIYFKKPKQDNMCDYDQSYLFQRKDDSPEVIKNRLKIYHAQTAPLINYYKQKRILIEINANLDVESTLKQIYQYIK